jgi:hypothetical protein
MTEFQGKGDILVFVTPFAERRLNPCGGGDIK